MNSYLVLKIKGKEGRLIVYKYDLDNNIWEEIGSLDEYFNVEIGKKISLTKKDLFYLSFIQLTNLLSNKYGLGINVTDLLNEAFSIFNENTMETFLLAYWDEDNVYEITSRDELLKAIEGDLDLNNLTTIRMEELLEQKLSTRQIDLERLVKSQMNLECFLEGYKMWYFARGAYFPFIAEYDGNLYVGIWSEPFIFRNRYKYPEVPVCIKFDYNNFYTSIYIPPSIAHPHVSGDKPFGAFCGGSSLDILLENSIEEINNLLNNKSMHPIEISKRIAELLSYSLETASRVMSSGRESPNDRGYAGKHDVDTAIKSGKYALSPQVISFYTHGAESPLPLHIRFSKEDVQRAMNAIRELSPKELKRLKKRIKELSKKLGDERFDLWESLKD